MPNIAQAIKDNIMITDCAEIMGYHVRQISAKRWTLEEHDSFNINIDPRYPWRQRFIWNSQGVGGSVIDFVMAIHGCTNIEAISELRQLLTSRSGEFLKEEREKRLENWGKIEPKELKIPVHTTGSPSRVYAYLNKKRGISYDIISQQIHNKTLYQDKKGNAVFVGYDYDGLPKHFTIRSTLSEVQFRGESDGSNKDVSFSMGLVGVDTLPTKLMVLESPIDAMSVATMFELCGRSSKDFAYLSLGGTAANALKYHLQHHPQLQVIYLCQDRDTGGEKSRKWCRKALIEAGYKGRVIDKLPTGKDFNEDLLAMRKARQQEIEQPQGLRHEPQI